jgi:hypothetical protein
LPKPGSAANVRKISTRHDARLVAAMLAQGLSNLLTLNRTDFLRYSEITAIDPVDISGAT